MSELSRTADANYKLDEFLTWFEKEYHLGSEEMAFLLLKEGTNYYLRDITERYLERKE